MWQLFWVSKRVLVFIMCFTFEIYFAEAFEEPKKEETQMVFFAEKPEKCAQYETYPCAISSGQSAHYFFWNKSRWELAKNTVLSGTKGNKWRAALGHFVLKSQDKFILETPFADIHLDNTDVFVELTETRVTVSVIKGHPVKIYPRGEKEEHLLSPGFMNWYAGIGPEGQDIGVPTVMDLQVYAKKRAHFFTDHKLGFVNELKELASTVKQATLIAAEMHQKLVADKRALLQAAYDAEVETARKRREFNRYLRVLFRRKVNYDD